MGILSKSKVDESELALTMKVVVGDREMPMSRPLRKIAQAEVKKLIQKHGSLIHPETKERPEVIFYQEKLGLKFQVRLVTDSVDLRNWLYSRGVPVHQELVSEDGLEKIGAAAPGGNA